MDIKSWVAVLELLPQWPLLIIAAFSIAGVAFWCWIVVGEKHHCSAESAARSDEPAPRVARDQNAAVQSKLADALNTVTAQERQLFTLKDTGWNPPVLGMKA